MTACGGDDTGSVGRRRPRVHQPRPLLLLACRTVSLTKRYPGDFDAPIIQAAPGTTEIVAAVPGKRIVLLGYHGTISDIGTLQWKSGSNNKSGAMPVDQRSGFVVPNTGRGIFATNPGEALNITTVGGAYNGVAAYRLED